MRQSDWTIDIKPTEKFLNLKVNEVWHFRDLLILLVRRDIVTVYKQTVLGPLWFIIQPILTTGMFTFVFGNLANIDTDGLPHVLFYLLGITIWNYFANCLNKTSNTFVANQNLFGKVYFPRVLIPMSIVLSNLAKFFIQFILFIFVWLYYVYSGSISPTIYIFFLPLVMIAIALLSLGFGMLFSAMTTKYRDLTFLLKFGVQLWMYATPIIYPISSVPEKYFNILSLNPLSSLIEIARLGFLGKGYFDIFTFTYSLVFASVIFIFGLLIFNKVEKKFMDTV